MEEEWLENSMQSFLKREKRRREKGECILTKCREEEWEELLNREEERGMKRGYEVVR